MFFFLLNFALQCNAGDNDDARKWAEWIKMCQTIRKKKKMKRLIYRKRLSNPFDNIDIGFFLAILCDYFDAKIFNKNVYGDGDEEFFFFFSFCSS